LQDYAIFNHLQQSDVPFAGFGARWGVAWRPPVVLRRVQEYVEAHLEQELTIEGLAAVAGLSPSHFAQQGSVV
jgi:AraC-like DNA-binding protein